MAGGRTGAAAQPLAQSREMSRAELPGEHDRLGCLWRNLMRLALLAGTGHGGHIGRQALPSSSSRVSITVLSIKPVNFGRIFALASVEIDIDGVLLVIHGVRAIRARPMGTRVDLPVFRDENGVWQRAITLPDEICGPIGKAVLDELVARGLAAKGPAFQPGAQ
jgi:hypothetical protein